MFDSEALVAVFNRALLDPPALDKAFTELPQVAHGSVAFMFSLVPGRPGLVGDAVAGEMQRAYTEESWQGADIFTGIARMLPIDELHLTDEFLPEQTVRAHKFFTDYLARWNIARGAGWWFDLDGEPWVFALGRSAAQGPFTPQEAEALAAASTRINWSIAALNRLAAARTMAICDTLDMVAAPYLVLDHTGLVMRTSAAATAMFDDSFGQQGALLRAADATANDLLQQVSTLARYGALGAQIAGIAWPQTIVIPRADGRHPVVARPLRLRRPLYDALPGAQIVLRLDDLAYSKLPSADLLEAIYGLSVREIAVAHCMLQGLSSAEIIEELKVKKLYLQQLVNSMFAKTRTHSRQELVALLSRVPDKA